MDIRWKTIVSQPFAENSYVVHRDGARECFVVDPGFEPELIQQHLENANLVPIAILNTHGHSDHIAGNACMKEHWPDARLIIGSQETVKLTDPHQNLSANYGVALISPRADETVDEGDLLNLAGMQWRVLETPGHSAGHVVFLNEQTSPPMLLGGDVLFREGVGRTDFPDGNRQQLMESIRNKLFTLADATRVLCGHGPETTIGWEKLNNPFVGRSAGD